MKGQELSAVDVLIQDHTSSSQLSNKDPFPSLATQVLHNLRYQHEWMDLSIHTSSSGHQDQESKTLHRPLVSGIPPRRIYIHPEEQINLIKAGVNDENVPAEPEWVLPSHIREKWTLRRFGKIFDAIRHIPPQTNVESREPLEENIFDKAYEAAVHNKWRQTKRLLLATVDDDSTIVYYVVHDGIVKPRQN